MVNSAIVIYLLFLLQFIYFPIGISYFETPKVYLAQLGIFSILLITVLRSKSSFFKDIPKKYVIAYSSIVVLSLIHMLFLPLETTFFGNDFRLQGVLLLWMLLLWSILSSKISFDNILHPIFLFGCLVAQLIFAFLIDGEGVTRAIGTLGEPNALAAVVLFVWPFLYFTKKPIHSWIKLGSLLIVFLIVYMSGSRSGMIAFTLQLVFILLSRTSLSTAKSVIVSVILLLLTYSLPFLPQANLYEQRSEIWQAALVAGGESPVVGNGFGNTEFAIQDAANSLNNNLRGSYVDSSHNILLDWWVQGGTIGLAIFSFFIVQAVRSFIKQKNTHYLVLLLGLMAVLSFNPASIVSLIALWWLIGQGIIETTKK
jgi:O-antigen ligase